MLDLTRLASFVALMDAGSFTAAGKALGLTKAAVSQHVRKLEDDLGCALVVRDTRHLAPTEAGSRLHATGTALLAEAERVETQAKQAVGLTGTIRLTSTSELLSVVLAPLLASFLAAHPRLRLEVSGASALADVVAERFDLAVRIGHAKSSTLRATKLTTFRLLPVAAPSLLARYGEPRAVDDLARLPWVVHRQHPNPMTWKHEGNGETRIVSLTSRFVTDVVETNRRLAVDGTYAGVAAEWRVRDDLDAGRLVRLFPEWTLPSIPIYVVRPASAQIPTKVRALIQHLRDALE